MRDVCDAIGGGICDQSSAIERGILDAIAGTLGLVLRNAGDLAARALDPVCEQLPDSVCDDIGSGIVREVGG